MEILPSPDIPMPKQVSQSLTASALASFILSQGQNEKLESPLLTFSNYLSYICDSTEVITPELINRFYYRALLFSGWQKNFETLVASTMVVVRTYCERGRDRLLVCRYYRCFAT